MLLYFATPSESSLTSSRHYRVQRKVLHIGFDRCKSIERLDSWNFGNPVVPIPVLYIYFRFREVFVAQGGASDADAPAARVLRLLRFSTANPFVARTS